LYQEQMNKQKSGHVILPLQGAGGSRCSVKPASRGPPLSKVHDTCWRKPPTPPFDGGPCTNSLLGAGRTHLFYNPSRSPLSTLRNLWTWHVWDICDCHSPLRCYAISPCLCSAHRFMPPLLTVIIFFRFLAPLLIVIINQYYSFLFVRPKRRRRELPLQYINQYAFKIQYIPNQTVYKFAHFTD